MSKENEINHLFKYVEGAFDMDKGKLICVSNKKWALVELCFRGSMSIPLAQIKLHSRDRAVDADAVFDDAIKLGEEIAKRWNKVAGV